MRKERLQAMSGTTIEHDLCKHLPAEIRHPTLTPELTMPVFVLPKGLVLTEAVAITYRDADEKPIDGGLFGVASDGEVVQIALVDAQHGVDTDEDPAWVAFGLTMSIGKLMVCGDNGTEDLPWSIVDFGHNTFNDSVCLPTPGRVAVHAAYCARMDSSRREIPIQRG